MNARHVAASFALALLLTACSQSAAPPVVEAKGSALVLHYSTDEPGIGSEVGERRLGAGTRSTGRAGWLLFGPYAALPAGRFRVELQGLAEPGNTGTMHVDVARDKGATVVAAIDLDAAQLAEAASDDAWVVLPFTLAEPASDLEVRVRVSEASRLSVSGYVIRATP